MHELCTRECDDRGARAHTHTLARIQLTVMQSVFIHSSAPSVSHTKFRRTWLTWFIDWTHKPNIIGAPSSSSSSSSRRRRRQREKRKGKSDLSIVSLRMKLTGRKSDETRLLLDQRGSKLATLPQDNKKKERYDTPVFSLSLDPSKCRF